MSRRALVVGIDHYKTFGSLRGCVADAQAMEALLAWHEDGRPNYECRMYLGTRDSQAAGTDVSAADGGACGANEPDGAVLITRPLLRRLLTNLFADADGDVLLYFAGHGAVTATGAFLCTSDGVGGDVGVSMDEVLQLASRSRATGVVILLDCCHAGSLGNPGMFAGALADTPLALLRQEVTIVAAARATEPAVEADGHGVFTAALLDALRGGARDVLGHVTAPALYAYAERRFGAWDQRPVYKSHATHCPLMRECTPAIDLAKFRRLPKLFPTADYQYPLDPRYEAVDAKGQESADPDNEKIAIGNLLRDYRDAGLLRPTVRGEQLFWTATYSHTVELTAHGQHYWWLAQNGKI